MPEVVWLPAGVDEAIVPSGSFAVRWPKQYIGDSADLGTPSRIPESDNTRGALALDLRPDFCLVENGVESVLENRAVK